MNATDLKKWRKEVRLTRSKMAEMLDVTETTIYRWETGKAPITKVIELAIQTLTQRLESELKNAKNSLAHSPATN